MSGDWILLSEAADLLKTRGQNPRPCIATMITKRLWRPVLPFREWAGSNGRWLGTPEFDINTSRLVVEVHTLRRGPAAHLAARQWRGILVSKPALDELWPDTAAHPSTKRSGGGRRSGIDDYDFELAFQEKVNEEGGVPTPEGNPNWKTQADAEGWARDYLSAKGTPLSEEPIRRRIRKLLNKMAEGGN